MIPPCRIEVVDAMFDSVIDHFERCIFVHVVVIAIDYRKPHSSETERGQLHPLEFVVLHDEPLSLKQQLLLRIG